MTKNPFMQLYIADYLADTQHLTTEQHGAYLLLLMNMWRCGGYLPKDDKKLARIARISARRWHSIADDVLAFFDIDGDHITQKRLVEEHKKATLKSDKRSNSGKLGGQAKSLKNNDAGLAIAKQMPKHLLQSTNIIKDNANALSQKSENMLPDIARQALGKKQHATEFRETFWPAWPNKVGRPKALASWLKARKTASLESIMDGVSRYVDSKPPDRQWLNPTTFLTQERWLDQPAIVAGSRGPPAAKSQGVAEACAELIGEMEAGNYGQQRKITGSGQDNSDAEFVSAIGRDKL